MAILKPTKEELREVFKNEVTKDLIIQKPMNEEDQRWWFKHLSNLGKLLQIAWDKKKGRTRP